MRGFYEGRYQHRARLLLAFAITIRSVAGTFPIIYHRINTEVLLPNGLYFSGKK